jgi:phage shock protein A
MQTVMAEGQARIDRMEDALRTSRRRLADHTEQVKKLEADRDLAVAKEKDDVARMLIRKCHPLRLWVAIGEAQCRTFAEDLADERERLAEQTVTYETLRLRVAAVRERSREKRVTIGAASIDASPNSFQPSEEEIEWELLQLKEALASGRTP